MLEGKKPLRLKTNVFTYMDNSVLIITPVQITGT